MSIRHCLRLSLVFIICCSTLLVLGQPRSSFNTRNVTESTRIDEIYHEVLFLLNAGKERPKAYEMAQNAMRLSQALNTSQHDKWKARFIHAYASQELKDEHNEPYNNLRQLISEIDTTDMRNTDLRRNIYHSLTSSCLLLNKLDSALHFAQNANVLGKQLFGENSCERVMDYFLLAYTLIESAQDDSALKASKRALQLAESNCEIHNESYIDAHRLMGYYYIKSNYQASRAIPYYKRALHLSMEVEDADRAFKSLYFICRTALLSNDEMLLAEHIHYFDSIRLISDHITGVKSDLARIDIEFTMANQNRDIHRAIVKKNQFRKLLLDELPERQTAIFESYYSIVNMSIQTDRKKDILNYLGEMDSYVGKNKLNQDQLLSYHEIKSNALLHLHRWDEALQAAEKGIRCLTQDKFKTNYRPADINEVDDLFFYRIYSINCSKYYEHQFNTTGSTSDLKESQKNLSQVIAAVVRMIERDDERMSIQTTEEIAQDFERLISTDMKLFKLTGSNHYLQEAFELTDIASNLTFFRGANQRRAMTRTAKADSLIELKKKLTKRLINIQVMKENNSSLSRYQNEKKELDLSIQITQINQYFEEHEPLYLANIRAINSVPTVDFQSEVLDSSTAYIQYFYYKQLYAFLVLENQVIPISLPISDNFSSELNNYNSSVSSPSSTLEYFAKASRSLGSTLLDSILIHLPTSIDHLIITPYGELANVVFESLLIKSTEQTNFGRLPYLVNSYAVSYAFSMTSKYRNNATYEQKISESFLGVSPLYENNSLSNGKMAERSKNDLLPLQGAQQEVLALGHLIKKSKILMGESATKGNIIDQLSNHSIWHFAMHALLDDQNPMMSSLYFTNQGQADSGALTAAEIYNMELEADLVVLSACNSGVGEYDYAQGTMSLARAFAYAGAQATILSSWPAPDKATSEFFPLFYNHLINGQSKAQALQTTKSNWLKDQTASQFHHPYYWSTFTLWGNTKTLDCLSRNTSFQWWVVVLIAMICLLIFLSLSRKPVQEKKKL